MEKEIKERLQRLACALIDQEAANILVEPQVGSEGFWFGGGNVICDSDGTFWLCGRYRNHGDSRTGVGAGERGLELAIFSSDSVMGPWEKKKSFTKKELQNGNDEVVSIEGAALLMGITGVELFLSTEKDRSYPSNFIDYQKSGTGIWDIDIVESDSIMGLDPSTVYNVIRSDELGALHVKDPVPFQIPGDNDQTGVFFCSHPYTWASSNTGLAVRGSGQDQYKIESFNVLSRGNSWDVACTRITDRLAVPPLGDFSGMPQISIYFYDGAECLRFLDESAVGVSRSRGFSCEEIGGMAAGFDQSFPEIHRISSHEPMFVSPQGTGCSRYVSTLITPEGILATWQQSQENLSQPLVGNFLPNQKIEEILS
ncbi:MAG: hypothetical protein P8I97_00995 [Verrucomicrobiales bacterium]|nr:hypothetical protein [Verrucomicrobiales bacterium]